MSLNLPASCRDAIFAHASQTYPHECCGILLGRVEGGLLKVEEARPAANLNTERARDRYLLDPKDQIRAEKDARATGREVLGFYHSHPDHPAAPSVTDRSQSHPVYAYLIVAVSQGNPGPFRCFQQNGQVDDNGPLMSDLPISVV